MISPEDWWTLKAMEKFGGCFVRALATLYRLADHENQAKTKNTWSLYWKQYQHMGIRLEQEHDREIELKNDVAGDVGKEE